MKHRRNKQSKLCRMLRNMPVSIATSFATSFAGRSVDFSCRSKKQGAEYVGIRFEYFSKSFSKILLTLSRRVLEAETAEANSKQPQSWWSVLPKARPLSPAHTRTRAKRGPECKAKVCAFYGLPDQRSNSRNDFPYIHPRHMPVLARRLARSEAQ